MAARTLESRFERMSVNDENESVNAVGTYHKSKVSIENKARAFQQLINLGISLNSDVNIRPWFFHSIDFERQSLELAEACVAKHQRNQVKYRNDHDSHRSFASSTVAWI